MRVKFVRAGTDLSKPHDYIVAWTPEQLVAWIRRDDVVPVIAPPPGVRHHGMNALFIDPVDV